MLGVLADVLFGWEDAHHAAVAIQALVSAGAEIWRLRREKDDGDRSELVVGRSDGKGGTEEVPLAALLGEHHERIEKLERAAKRPRRRRRK